MHGWKLGGGRRGDELASALKLPPGRARDAGGGRLGGNCHAPPHPGAPGRYLATKPPQKSSLSSCKESHLPFAAPNPQKKKRLDEASRAQQTRSPSPTAHQHL